MCPHCGHFVNYVCIHIHITIIMNAEHIVPIPIPVGEGHCFLGFGWIGLRVRVYLQGFYRFRKFRTFTAYKVYLLGDGLKLYKPPGFLVFFMEA